MTRRLTILCLTVALGGCALFTKGHVGETKPAPSPPPRGPTGVGSETKADQQGFLNAAVGAVTGISLQQALPWSFMPLMAWQMFLSHRREMARVKRLGDTQIQLLKMMEQMIRAREAKE